jgi:hypothetical protein
MNEKEETMRRLQLANAPLGVNYTREEKSNNTLLYGAIALGLVAGAAASAYWWKGAHARSGTSAKHTLRARRGAYFEL